MINCPVCGQYVFEMDFDLCPVCDWQHDRVQEIEPDLAGGANKESLNEAKNAWKIKNMAVSA
jgi:uncharacterized Zn finger protein (UPF0148 family)